MAIRLNLTRESVKAFERNNFEVLDESNSFSWVAKFTESHLEELAEELTEKIEENKQYRHILEMGVFVRLKPKIPKHENFSPEMTRSLPEVIKLISDEIIKICELDKVEVKQQKLEMPK